MRLLQGLAVSSRPPRWVAARPGMQVDWQNGSSALQFESQRAMRERVRLGRVTRVEAHDARAARPSTTHSHSLPPSL